jgi:uncharacterized protein YjbI with pentapeptide repeats
MMQSNSIRNSRTIVRSSGGAPDAEIWITPHERRLLTLSPLKDNHDEVSSQPVSSRQRQLPENWVYENIKDAIYHCRRIFYIYLGILCYTLLTISTSPILDFFKGQLIKMPIMDAHMPLNYYLVLAPLLLIGFFVYKQLYLYKTNKLIKYAIDECKNLNREKCRQYGDQANKCTMDRMCSRHLSRLYPWIIIYCRFMENGSNVGARKDRLSRVVGKAQQVFVSFSLWWLLPVILLFLSLFIVKKHSLGLSSFMLSVTCFGNAIVAFFWYLQQKLLDRTSSAISSIHRKLKLIFAATVLSLLLLLGLNIIAFHGTLPWKQSAWLEEKAVSLTDAVIRHFAFADLSHTVIAKEPESEQLYWIDLEKRHLEGANLTMAKLKRANLKFTHLKNAFLQQANLEQANLRGIYASGADFTGANLIEASFIEADLKGADFSNANLRGAQLTNAVLEGGEFRFADLSGAYLTGSRARGANFYNANLQSAFIYALQGIDAEHIRRASNYPLAYYSADWIVRLGLPQNHNALVETKQFSNYNFTSAFLNDADFSDANLTHALFDGAYLRRANLRGADLRGAVLSNADFQEANLLGIKFTSCDQFSKAKTLYRAKMDVDLRGQLQTLYPHLVIAPPLTVVKKP